jgi:FeS assembly protein IscX
MADKLTWDDAQRIGILLSKKHPELDPSTVDVKDLHRYTTELPWFSGDRNDVDQNKLEAIHAAWNTEFLERTQ